MKRRVYVICQKRNWETGSPQAVSDGDSQIEFVFAEKRGLERAKEKVEIMNRDKGLHPVHVRKAMLVFEEEIKCVKRDL